ncbi:hypothetical protein FRC01_009508 [Tulasnella sp. 417]|nr:hypothetical protein FRC01_009508 [Tulasnella sp. 417]
MATFASPFVLGPSITAYVICFGKYTEAKASYIEAVAIFKNIEDDHDRANALEGLGESIVDDRGRANALKGLGDFRRQQSKDIAAEAYYAEAVAIFKSIEEGLGRADALFALGDVHQAQSKYLEAEANYVEALAIYNGRTHYKADFWM